MTEEFVQAPKTYVRINGQDIDTSAVKLPDRELFRNAWDLDGDAVVVNMDKARNIHRDALRAKRTELFAKADHQYRIADEDGDTDAKSAAIAYRKQLRDVTKDSRIDEASTPEELKALTIDVLLGD